MVPLLPPGSKQTNTAAAVCDESTKPWPLGSSANRSGAVPTLTPTPTGVGRLVLF